MSATVHVISRRKLSREASKCAESIYDAQAVVRVCMAVIEEHSTAELPRLSCSELNRHTVWRALRVADRLLQDAAEATDELACPE